MDTSNSPEQGRAPLLVRTLRGEAPSRPPFWFMRQAGRYLPEYQEVRQQAGGFLELCYDPKRATEVTLQPVRRFGMDAAILFSDILVVPHALGCEVWFEANEGPRLARIGNDIEVGSLSLEKVSSHLEPVYEAVSLIRGELANETALIGFSALPWTLAGYMIEGRGSKDWLNARLYARRNPEAFKELVDILTDAIVIHLSRQVEAGAQVLQLFDSWAGALSPSELQRWSIEPCSRIVSTIHQRYPAVPVIGFPRGVGLNYPAFVASTGIDAVSLDTTVPPLTARQAFDGFPKICLQGNLDPVTLVVGGDAMLREADAIIDAWRGRPFIFNLGHGVLPVTQPTEMERLCKYLQSTSL